MFKIRIPASLSRVTDVRFFSWECQDFRRRRDHILRRPKNSQDVFRQTYPRLQYFTRLIFSCPALARVYSFFETVSVKTIMAPSMSNIHEQVRLLKDYSRFSPSVQTVKAVVDLLTIRKMFLIIRS